MLLVCGLEFPGLRIDPCRDKLVVDGHTGHTPSHATMLHAHHVILVVHFYFDLVVYIDIMLVIEELNATLV